MSLISAVVGNGLLTLNSSGRIVSANDAACQLSGYSKAELTGQEFSSLFPAEQTSGSPHPVVRTLSGTKPVEFRSKPKSRALQVHAIPAEISGALKSAAAKIVVILKPVGGHVDDPRAARIQMVGHFTTGVVHDVNNDLTAVLGNNELAAGLIKDYLEGNGRGDPDKLRDALRHLDHVEAVSRHTAALASQLLAYARQKPSDRLSVEVNGAVLETVELTRMLLSPSILVEVELAEGLEPALAARAQIDRVLTNLILNARDAMPDGGVIKIQTAEEELDESFTSDRPGWARPGRFIRLSVINTGKGMDAPTLKRIYEEFFTTKATGTGLGLRIVYHTVKDVGGMVEATSEPGRGARFDIYLRPAAGVTTSDTRTIRAPLARAPRRRGDVVVLIAEPNENVRTLMSRVLAQAGYKVLTAPDGSAAVSACREAAVGGSPVGVVVMDADLPELNSEEAILQIKEMSAETSFVITSGAGSELSQPPAADRLFMTKPFDGYELLEAVDAAAERTARGLGPERRKLQTRAG